MQEREQIRNIVGALERHHKEILTAREQGRKGRMPLLNMCFCGPVGTEANKKSKAFQKRKVALIENGFWRLTAARTMRGILETMKEVELLEPVVTIKSTMKEANVPALEQLAEVLVG